MRPSPLLPTAHLFVCANARPLDDPLGPGCSAAGEALFLELKREVARRGSLATIWVTKTHCLGICPKRGAACAIYPKKQIVTEAESTDAARLVSSAQGEAP